ncbi:hypothetical protein [Pedobacter psychroterrae]|uniref:Uncharacterized protein n=1 Tax=Pedobacter psychroterrae TaxID=2530453 RepID=A0A4R0NAX3_9SPHI|nr:hypothetical protein [Pedobacter psychroterrae]TCC96403.1 hypothetical protein EZ437_21260 [Pedobacter psychroterrae]
MKISTTMLVIAILLFFGVLTAYNFSLKAEYLKGTFRDRFGKHSFMKLEDVKRLQLNAANMIGMSIEYGEREGVWISKEVKDQVKVRQSGETVTVDFVNSKPKTYRYINAAAVVFIVNKVNRVDARNFHFKDQGSENYGGELFIKGLSGNSLDMVIPERATVLIEGSQFKVFKAVIGNENHWSSFTVTGDNRFDTAYFDIRKSSLELQNPKILVPHYKFGDSSRIGLWGHSAKQFAR